MIVSQVQQTHVSIKAKIELILGHLCIYPWKGQASYVWVATEKNPGVSKELTRR